MRKTRKRRKSGKHSFKFEIFFLNYGMQIAGTILILAGLLYLFISGFKIYVLLDLWNSFTHYSPKMVSVPQSTESNLLGYQSLLFLVPGIILIIIPHILQKARAKARTFLFALGLVCLISAEVKILLDIRSHFIQLNYYLVLISFGAILVISTVSPLIGKNRFALNGTVIFFFISIFFIRLIYGVILPNIISLIVFQVVVSIYCYKLNWRSPFVLLMTISFFYISYYFLKLVLFANFSGTAYTYMQPSLLTWFILSVTGSGILKPVSSGKAIVFIWNKLAYFTLFVVIAFSIGFYYKSGTNYLSLAYYVIAVLTLIGFTFLDQKYSFITNNDPYYFAVCIFSAFLFPMILHSGFFLILSASLAVTLLIHVKLTDLKTSLHLSIGMYFITLGLYLVFWAFKIVPALFAQRIAGTDYPFQLLLGSLLLFALADYYKNLFSRVLKEYSFSYTQNKKYQNSVGVAYYSIGYLTGFLAVDYLLVQLIPGYRVNLIEWSLYTYLYLYFLFIAQNPKSRVKLWYTVILSALAVGLYPIFIHGEAIHFRTLYLAGESKALLPFLMHYVCIGVIILIFILVKRRLRLLYASSRFIVKTLTLIGIALLCFILLSEYDHLLMLVMNRFSRQPAYEILEYNKFIPYSVIILSVAVVMLIFSLIRYTRFLRRLSMFMILAVLLKVLFIDITILPANKSIILLISLGAIFIVLSRLIPRFRKQSRTGKSPETLS